MPPNRPIARRVVRFDSFTVDCERGLVLRDGVRLKLQPQPLRVLSELLLNAPEVVSREALTQAVWPEVHVDTDASLNFCIRQIRAVLEDSASDARYVETLPKQGYRFIGRIDRPEQEPSLELPATTGEAGGAAGLEARDEGKGRGTWRRLSGSSLAMMGMVVLALILFGIGAAMVWFGGGRRLRGPLTSLHSLAVLPLTNVSGDPAQEYLAAGVTDELTTQLARTTTLRVVSRTSVLQYRDARRPIGEIARELGVDGVVEGSIARKGDKLHLTVQLIDARTDTHLWAESYDRSFDGTPVLSAEVGTALARETRSLRPGLAATSRTIDPAAHDAYLRGNYLWFNGQNEAAGRLFLRATQIQPDYPLAWAGLCNYYGAGTLDLTHKLDPRLALPLAYAAARKSVELDPTLAEAHLCLGGTMFTFRWNWTGAEAEIARAIELDPKLYQAVHFRAKLLNVLNRPEEAIQTEKAAEELNPFARPWAVAQTLLMARHFDEALAAVQQQLEGAPTNTGLEEVLMETNRALGRHAETVQAMAKWLEETGDPRAADEVRSAFRRGGYPAALQWELDRLEVRRGRQYVSPMEFAEVHAELGERRKTLDDLEDALRWHAPDLLWVQIDPAFDFLHAEPRYREVVRRTGLPPTY